MTRVKSDPVTDMRYSNTGVDMHSPSPVWSYTVLNAEEFTEEAIWAEIKAKRTSFIYDAYPAYGYVQSLCIVLFVPVVLITLI
jgi:hypothetical protein